MHDQRPMDRKRASHPARAPDQGLACLTSAEGIWSSILEAGHRLTWRESVVVIQPRGSTALGLQVDPRRGRRPVCGSGGVAVNERVLARQGQAADRALGRLYTVAIID